MIGNMLVEHLAWARHRNLRPGTIDQRRYQLTRLARWLMTSAPAAGLSAVDLIGATPDHLRAWQLSIEHLSAQTRATMVNHARAFYRWAIDRDLVDHRLLRHLVAPKVPAKLPRPVGHDALHRALETAPRRLLPWLLLGAFAGLRACEVAPLHADDIDLVAGTLFVVEGKGGKQRMVTLGPELVALLRPLLPRTGYLFPALTRTSEPIPGSHVSPGQVSRLGSQHLLEAGVTPPKFHALRHRYGSDVWEATKDMRLLQELLGHASPATVAVYTLIAPDRYAAAAAAVSARLGVAASAP